MGVGLKPLIVSDKIPIASLGGKIIAIDAYNMLYQFLTTIRQPDGTPLMDSNGAITSHLAGLFYRTIKLLEIGIKPVFVFDGQPPIEKAQTIESRKKTKQAADEKYREAIKKKDMILAMKYAKRTSRITKDMVSDAKELIAALGLPYIDAPSEGEAQAAYMVKTGIVDFTASQDYDSLLFGADVLIRNLSVSSASANNILEKIILKKLLRTLDITQEQLIMLGILIGTDYNPSGIKGIGPKKAISLVKKYNSLDKIIKHIEWTYPIEITRIYDLFINPEVKHISKLEFSRIDNKKVIKILCESHNFSQERINDSLQNLAKSTQQKHLSDWFR